MLPLQAKVTPSYSPPPKTHTHNNNRDLGAAGFKTSVSDTGRFYFLLKFIFVQVISTKENFLVSFIFWSLSSLDFSA